MPTKLELQPSPNGRLMGLETEYAIRYRGEPRPRHDFVFEALVAALRREGSVFKGERHPLNQQVFVDSGGTFSYEFQPSHAADGLVEASTPECRGPGQVVVYQRAQERLLKRALNRVHPHLAHRGFFGPVGLLKNARDAGGRGYGTHENYEVEVARGLRLWAMRAGMALLLPFAVLVNLVIIVVAVANVGVLVVLLLFALLVALVVPRTRPPIMRWFDPEERDGPLERVTAAMSLGYSRALIVPVTASFSTLYAHTFFVAHRRALGAHLASRVLYAGSGCLLDDGHLWLSERATTLTGVQRTFDLGPAHVVFDSGNLLKTLCSPQFLRFSPLLTLFRRRQRLQIAYSDSNRCQVAEFLKVGTTSLLLDMVDAGWLMDPPCFARPFSAYKSLARDPNAPVATTDGRRLDALMLQRWYLERAQDFVEHHQGAGPDAELIVALWTEVLDEFEKDPATLVGRVDWVTKRHLMNAPGLEGQGDAKKKIDLRYAELGSGYFDRLADRGLTVELAESDEVDRAMREPPRNSPACARGKLLDELSAKTDRLYVTWDQVRVGSWMWGRVVRVREDRAD